MSTTNMVDLVHLNHSSTHVSTLEPLFVSQSERNSTNSRDHNMVGIFFLRQIILGKVIRWCNHRKWAYIAAKPNRFNDTCVLQIAASKEVSIHENGCVPCSHFSLWKMLETPWSYKQQHKRPESPVFLKLIMSIWNWIASKVIWGKKGDVYQIF